jgi:hypothetical protein
MECVSLEDRDWYREQPSEAWTRMVRESGGGPFTSPAPRAGYQPRLAGPSPTTRVPIRVLSAVAAIVVLAVAAFGFRGTIHNILSGTRSPAPLIVIPHVPTDPRVVRLRLQPGLDTPATAVTTWSISDPRFGRISVAVPVGETPRQALSIELAERGYQLVG